MLSWSERNKKHKIAGCRCNSAKIARYCCVFVFFVSEIATKTTLLSLVLQERKILFFLRADENVGIPTSSPSKAASLVHSTPHFGSEKPQGGGTNLEYSGTTESVAHPNMRPQANAFCLTAC